jgi:hypothetical protein
MNGVSTYPGVSKSGASSYIETHLGGGAIMQRKPPALRSIGIDRNQRTLERFECSYPVEL